MKLLALVLFLAATHTGVRSQGVDYPALYDKAVTFSAFLDGARARAVDWRRNLAEAVVADDMVARVRQLPAVRRILIVSDPACSDSLATVPYLAKLVDAAPDRLELRILNNRDGRAIMDAHQTPDGRAATPTVVVLGEDGRFIGAWSERPAALQKWYVEQKPSLDRDQLSAQKARWYADDGGRSAVAEIVAILQK